MTAKEKEADKKMKFDEQLEQLSLTPSQFEESGNALEKSANEFFNQARKSAKLGFPTMSRRMIAYSVKMLSLSSSFRAFALRIEACVMKLKSMDNVPNECMEAVDNLFNFSSTVDKDNGNVFNALALVEKALYRLENTLGIGDEDYNTVISCDDYCYEFSKEIKKRFVSEIGDKAIEEEIIDKETIKEDPLKKLLDENLIESDYLDNQTTLYDDEISNLVSKMLACKIEDDASDNSGENT